MVVPMENPAFDNDCGLAPSLAFNPYGDGLPGIIHFSRGDYGRVLYSHDPVPEPTSGLLLIVGFGALGAHIRCRVLGPAARPCDELVAGSRRKP